MTGCPEIEVLQGRMWNLDLREHVAACGACKLVMELIDERSQAAESRDRRVECARFEALIAVRMGAELRGAAHGMLEEHLHDCTECRAIAQTMAPADEAPDHDALPAINTTSYALGAEVARGGMGRIIAARDLRIGRPVAVKELLAKSAGLAARFEREARVTARLQHPGIVPIYEIGRWESGTPFYAMRMVEGKTLRAALLEATTPAARLALLPSVIAAAEAVAFAHAHQVIHRDLTPSNILVGEYGETVVIDWGLAKELSESDEEPDVGPYRRDPSAPSDLTAAGTVIGTAAYMPPEQAAGERVDERADVYALGALLYHLLTGHAPYKGTLEDVLRAVKSEPPVPLPATTPRDLASIVTKAMARDPGDRYPSAKELAAELTAFQAGRLVDAHEYTRGELVKRFVRRNRKVLGVVAIAATVLGVVGVLAVRGVLAERDVAEQQTMLAESGRMRSESLALTLLAEQGRQELLAGHATRALPYLSAAYSQGDTSADTRFMIAAAMHDLDAREHVLETKTEVADLAFSRDGEQLLAIEDNTITTWRVATGVAGAPLRAPAEVVLTEAVFSPDGKRIAANARDPENRWPAIYLFDVATGTRRDLVGHTHSSTRPLFTPDGKYLITVSWDGTWRRWDVETGEARVTKTKGPPRYGKGGPVGAGVPALDRAGERLLTMNWEGKLELWNVATGLRLWELDSKPTYGASFHPDGTRVLTCNLEEAILWDLATSKVIARRRGPEFHLARCDFRPDGKAIVLVGDRTEVVVWDERLDRQLSRFFEEGGLMLPQFAGVDRVVLPNQFGTAGVAVWDMGLETRVALFEDAGKTTAASADGRRLAVSRPYGGVEIWRLDQSRLRRRFTTDDVKNVNISLDGSQVVAESQRGLVRIHDVARGGAVVAAPPLRMPVDVAGGRVAANSPEGDVVIVDAAGSTVGRFAPPSPATGLVLTEDGTRVLVTHAKGTELREASTGRVLASIPISGQFANVSGDGTRVMVLVGQRLTVWDVARSQVRATIELAGPVLFDFVLVSRDGSRIGVPVVREGQPARPTDFGFISLELFDDTGNRLARIPNAVFPTFAASTDRIFASGIDGVLHVLRFADGKELQRLPIEARFGIAQVTADGTRLAIATTNGASEIRSVIDGRLLYRYVARPAIPNINAETRDFGYSFSIANGFNGIRDDLFVAGNENGSAIATWDIHLETRSPSEIAKLVDERVPWRLEAGKLVKRDGKQ